MKKTSIFSIFFVIFLDMLGVGVIIPILAPLFLNPASNILPAATSEATRNIILGVLMAMYPLFQFFGAPILGILSDRIGRKKILIISLAGTFIGYLIFAIGILIGNIYLLFISRIIDGFTGGNISVAQSAIADISTNEEKARNFGLIGMAFGLGFILGPFIGGKLSDPTLLPWFNFSTPFFFTAFITLVNIILLAIRFQETLHTTSNKKLNIFTGFQNIGKAWKMKELRAMFIIMFLIIFGFNFFTQFFQVYLVQTFNFNQSQIGDIFAYIGIWIAITQGGIMRPLSRKFTPRQIMKVSLVALSISLMLILLPRDVWALLLVMPLVALSNGLTTPNSIAIISSLAKPSEQGEILGINQSVQSLAMTIPPIIAGIIVSMDKNLPIMVASISTYIAWLLFLFLIAKKKTPAPVTAK
ncbi:MFS transporter [Candidatus Peregrinibacteria bacterium]|nr:MFS transporter [Candidatus Peregrinibacteria bacterium]